MQALLRMRSKTFFNRGSFSVLEAEEIDTMSSPSSLLYPYTTNTAVEDEDDVLLCSEENITEGGIYINQVFKTSFLIFKFPYLSLGT